MISPYGQLYPYLPPIFRECFLWNPILFPLKKLRFIRNQCGFPAHQVTSTCPRPFSSSTASATARRSQRWRWCVALVSWMRRTPSGWITFEAEICWRRTVGIAAEGRMERFVFFGCPKSLWTLFFSHRIGGAIDFTEINSSPGKISPAFLAP